MRGTGGERGGAGVGAWRAGGAVVVGGDASAREMASNSGVCCCLCCLCWCCSAAKERKPERASTPKICLFRLFRSRTQSNQSIASCPVVPLACLACSPPSLPPRLRQSTRYTWGALSARRCGSRSWRCSWWCWVAILVRAKLALLHEHASARASRTNQRAGCVIVTNLALADTPRTQAT